MTNLISPVECICKPVKIVLIEDNPEVVRWISEKMNGFEKLQLAGVSTTYKGAFEMIERVNPKLIILDLKLPDGNGIDILKKIQQAKLNISVMVLSLNIQAKNSCLRMGVDYFFDKSRETNRFLEKLKEFDL